MEERYINMSRRGPEQRRPSRRPVREEDWDEPPRKRKRTGRSPVISAAMGFYKLLVAVSAVIVAVYLGFTLLMRAPEQSQLPPPQNGTNTAVPGGDSGGAKGQDGNEAGLQRRKGVYTILLAATDVEGYRTDTMMVMCYDTVEQTVGVVSVPRDTLIDRGDGHPKLVYGKGGVEQRVEDISRMLGIPIDGYIKVNIKGFITLVDYLGGIDFYVPCNMDYDDPYQDLYIHFSKGMRHLNGIDALKVVRFREGYASQDIGRMQTQQDFLKAVAKKLMTPASILKLDDFCKIFLQYVDTELTVGNLVWMGTEAANMGMENIEFSTLPGAWKSPYIYLDQEAVLALVNERLNPYVEDRTAEDLNIPA